MHSFHLHLTGNSLLFTRESPRWLVMKGREPEALRNLAFLRRRPVTDQGLIEELAEIEAAVREDREARAGLGWREAFLAPGNRIRFVIAFVIFFLQQFSGQNSVNYYAPTSKFRKSRVINVFSFNCC